MLFVQVKYAFCTGNYDAYLMQSSLQQFFIVFCSSVEVIEKLVHLVYGNPICIALHRKLKARFSDILKAHIATANLKRRVVDGDPRLVQSYYPSYFRPSRSITRWILV